MTRLRLLREDSGAFAVLYAILVVVLVGLVALVLDTATLRSDRRINRAAADAAALAGATKLGLTTQFPWLACQSAMRYAEASLDVTTPGADNCLAVFKPPGGPSAAAMCTAGLPRTAFEDVAGRHIQVTWPVPNSSPLMTNPDMENTAQLTQVVSDSKGPDGTPCLRVGIQIFQHRQAPFGSVLGFGSGDTTSSHSVALDVADGGPGDVPAPLVVLDKTSCNALSVTGGGGTGGTNVSGGVIVEPTAPDADGQTFPGAIAVDSAASGPSPGDSGTSCTSSSQKAIEVDNNSRIWTLDGTNGEGSLYSFAEITNPTQAYSGNLAGCPARGTPWIAPPDQPPNLCRQPTPADQVGPFPWVNRYNCHEATENCQDAPPGHPPYPSPRNYVDQWQAFAEGTVPPTWTNIISTCTLNGLTAYVGNTYTSCPTLRINGTLIVTGGYFVAKGNVDVKGGCLLLNDANTADCSNPPAYVPPDQRTVNDSLAYLGGDLTVETGGSTEGALGIVQTMLFLKGRLQLTTKGVINWSGPYGYTLSQFAPALTSCQPSSSSLTAPSPGCFDALGMWSPYAGTTQGNSVDTMNANAAPVVDGTLFMPNSAFTYSGSALTFQERAQFVCRLLNVTGGGLLTMVPDPDRSTEIPRGRGELIR